MIKLYRKEKSAKADAIEAEFRELVLGYGRVVVDENASVEFFSPETILPVIIENEKVVSGDQIQPYIKELGRLMRDWQSFQGDYCYVDGDGETC